MKQIADWIIHIFCGDQRMAWTVEVKVGMRPENKTCLKIHKY